MSILKPLKFIIHHPLNRNYKAAALIRWLRWQIGGRLLPGPVVVPFVNDTRLIVQPGLKGATGNIYAGLHDFEDMSFLLHALRSSDVFIDVGANVGSYTILASAGVGANCTSIEPIPEAYGWLLKNIAINGISQRVKPLNIGIGRAEDMMRFTCSLDTVNHVVEKNEKTAQAIDVPVQPLDSVIEGQTPTIIKIDVEGFETEVIAGASGVLANTGLLGVIMELNGSGRRYGFDEDELHRKMLKNGFNTYRYAPFERKFTPLNGERPKAGNTLYIRNIETVRERVQSAPAFRVHNHLL